MLYPLHQILKIRYIRLLTKPSLQQNLAFLYLHQSLDTCGHFQKSQSLILHEYYLYYRLQQISMVRLTNYIFPYNHILSVSTSLIPYLSSYLKTLSHSLNSFFSSSMIPKEPFNQCTFLQALKYWLLYCSSSSIVLSII